MDPQLQALAQDLEAKFDTLKTAQTNVAPLQTAADAANSTLAEGKQLVTTATNDVETSLTALTSYIRAGEPGGNPPPPPSGGGTQTETRRPMQTGRR